MRRHLFEEREESQLEARRKSVRGESQKIPRPCPQLHHPKREQGENHPQHRLRRNESGARHQRKSEVCKHQEWAHKAVAMLKRRFVGITRTIRLTVIKIITKVPPLIMARK